MGFMSKIALVYAVLFLISVFWFGNWLSLEIGFLGAFIVVTLFVLFGNINKTKADPEPAKGKEEHIPQGTE